VTAVAIAVPAQAKTKDGWETSCFSTHQATTISKATIGNWAHTHWPKEGAAKVRTGVAMSPMTVRVNFGWSTIRNWRVTATDFDGAYVECWEK
jgi:hypothetical protein